MSNFLNMLVSSSKDKRSEDIPIANHLVSYSKSTESNWCGWTDLVDLANENQAINLGMYETQQLDLALQKLVPELQKSIEKAISYFDQLLADLDKKAATVCNLGHIKLDMDSQEELGGTLYFAKLEIKEAEKILTGSLGKSSLWELLEHAGEVRRKITRIYVAIDLFYASNSKEPARLHLLSEHHLSRETRKAYAKLSNRVRRCTEKEATKRLRMASTEIAKLVGRDIYSDCRIRDRKILRDVQKRITDTAKLGANELGEDPDRLLEEVGCVIDLFGAINTRAILQEHDDIVIKTICDHYQSGVSQERINQEILSLYGMDKTLDDHIDGIDELDEKAILQLLNRLQAQK